MSGDDVSSWAAQLRKGCLELAILASLWDDARYGLEILRALQDGRLALAEGTLYPILNRLRQDGLLTAEWRDAGVGHPRKYYTLTELGRKRTKAMTAAWAEFAGQMTAVVQAVNEKERV